MAAAKRRAARQNVKKAQSAAQRRQTLKHLSSGVRTALAVEANRVRAGEAETRKELETEARRIQPAHRWPVAVVTMNIG